MRKLSLLIIIFTTSLLINVSCERKPNVSVDDEKSYVNNWIYKEMNTYYYWNKKIPAKPDYSLAPDEFFKSLLNTYNKNTNPDGDRFSTITEKYVDLLNLLGGVSSDEIGFQYVAIDATPKGAATKKYHLLVLYPKLDTDAYAKGVKRGQFIVKIDNQDITKSNSANLLSGTGSRTLTLANRVYNSEKGEYELESAGNPVTIQMHKNFAEKPVYLNEVYTVNDKKIGYLVYNFFATDKGDGSHEYDKMLMSALSDIKAKGATEFVLDLRYNGGGAVSTAAALASALVKNRSTQNLLMTSEYNKIVNNLLEERYGKGYNESYFIDKIVKGEQTILDVPSLSFPRIYVLVSRWTASASELIINGLKPYMDVILIGETTVGKNVGSFPIYEKDSQKNKWGILPITFKYSNKDGKSDFTAGFTPDYAVSESEPKSLPLVDFGSNEDVFLNRALNLIAGVPLISSSTRMAESGADLSFKIVENSESMKITELYDDRFQLNVLRN